METEARTHRWIPPALFVGALLLFSFNLSFPKTLNFDEFHYIPSAKQFLALTQNQNYEHPPLAKELIAVGLGLLGDHPVGWRIMSVLFGALTLVGVHRLALVLFASQEAALFTALLTAFNHMVFVQSRIAMLDTFMAAFLVWSWALGLEGWKTRNTPKLAWSGALVGWAIACKWFAIIPWVALLALAGALVLLRSPKAPRARTLVLAWGVLPVLTYYSSFIPFFWVTQKSGGSYGLFDILFQMQWAMWDGQSRVPGEHNYASRWWEWPLMLRPMWYAFDRESGPAAAVRGVALIGNPVVLWGGLAALVWTAWDWVEKRRAEAFLIVYAWAVCTFSWMVIPRKLAFFYYYYPAALWLAPAWIYLLQQGTPRGRQRLFMSAVTAVSLLLFIHFFPILAALPIEPQGYLKWMWLRRWI